MAAVIEKVREASNGTHVMRSVFVTCDPARDTPEVLRRYLREFHPDIIGLTGTYDQVKHMCKQYRVYFSTPENVKPEEDYLVDHSIYFYLMGKYLCIIPCPRLLLNLWLTCFVHSKTPRGTLSNALAGRIRQTLRPNSS
jgi:cytochrome oxidase Cu insertion factor (SCO1/SenC/PrrC family)